MRRQKMNAKIKTEKRRWLVVLLMGCWLIAGAVGYGKHGQDEVDEGPGVILYKHAGFKGSRIFVKAGHNIKDLKKLGWNDKISSIELVDNARIRIYEHKNYQGASLTIKDDIFDLAELSAEIRGTWNDRISSIKVFHVQGNRDGVYDDDEEVYCIFYKHVNRRGSSFEGELGHHRKINRQWNDKISSLWIRKGYQVTLYEHDRFRGKRLVLIGKGRKGSVYNLDNYGFNDIVSSFKLERIGRLRH
jgi:hypothetical protein